MYYIYRTRSLHIRAMFECVVCVSEASAAATTSPPPITTTTATAATLHTRFTFVHITMMVGIKYVHVFGSRMAM